MKFSALTLLVAIACVSGTAGFSTSYLSSLGGAATVASTGPKKDYSPTSWKPTGERREAQIYTNSEAAVLETTFSPSGSTSSTQQLTDFLRTEYEAWLAHHGKTYDESRFKIFKDNYIRQWQSDRVTGQYHFLSAQGDMTEQECARAAAAKPAPAAAGRPASTTAAPKVASLQSSFSGAFSRMNRSHPYGRPEVDPNLPNVTFLPKGASLQSSFSGAFSTMSRAHPYIQKEGASDNDGAHDKNFAVYKLNN